jgi:hypothetical protein
MEVFHRLVQCSLVRSDHTVWGVREKAVLSAPLTVCGGWPPSLGSEREVADLVAHHDAVVAGIDVVELSCDRTEPSNAP